MLPALSLVCVALGGHRPAGLSIYRWRHPEHAAAQRSPAGPTDYWEDVVASLAEIGPFFAKLDASARQASPGPVQRRGCCQLSGCSVRLIGGTVLVHVIENGQC
jgi:hypothetical protein